MGIPESQLETWSRQGAITIAKNTHESVRNALKSYERLKEVDFEVYLQGSYKNDTNIRGDMDVDLVAQLNSTFLNNLSEEQKHRFEFTQAKYTWKDFRADVLRALKAYYVESKISEGNKAIKVQTPYLPADVVICLQYRRYPSNPVNKEDFVEGIAFWTTNESRLVINYPQIHYNNGVKKHQKINNKYKPVIRMFKNIRNYLQENYHAPDDLAPSYFLECLLYNVPDIKFDGSYRDAFCKIVNWLADAELEGFVCQNEQLQLFDNTPEQWSTDNAKRLIKNLIGLWRNW